MLKFKLANNKNEGGKLEIKSKNAFTLIELLAIIVILAIIAVITVPIILNIIENSRMGAATDSAYGYKDAVNKWYVTKLSEDNQFQLASSYTISSDGKLGDIVIPISGDKPSGGYLNYSNNTLTDGCLVIGEYQVTFDSNGNASETKKGNCSASNNNNENGQSGSPANEQVPQYTYGYLNIEIGSTNQLDSSWKNYLRKNTSVSTSPVEVCSKFSNGVICIEENKWNCEEVVDTGKEDEYGDTLYACSNLNSYVEQRRIEAESKGATCNYHYLLTNPVEKKFEWALICNDLEANANFNVTASGIVESYNYESNVWCETSTPSCHVSN